MMSLTVSQMISPLFVAIAIIAVCSLFRAFIYMCDLASFG